MSFGIGIFDVFVTDGIQIECMAPAVLNIPEHFFITRAPQVIPTCDTGRIVPYNFLIEIKRYFIPKQIRERYGSTDVFTRDIPQIEQYTEAV